MSGFGVLLVLDGWFDSCFVPGTDNAASMIFFGEVLAFWTGGEETTKALAGDFSFMALIRVQSVED